LPIREFFAQLAWSLLPYSIVHSERIFKGQLTKEKEPMLWTILVILLVLWLIGFLGHVGGGLIHLLLVIALIVFIINLVSGRRAV